jgi:hypothetical protein
LPVLKSKLEKDMQVWIDVLGVGWLYLRSVFHQKGRTVAIMPFALIKACIVFRIKQGPEFHFEEKDRP